MKKNTNSSTHDVVSFSRKVAILLLSVTVCIETILLSSVLSCSDTVYHSYHLAFMFLLCLSQYRVYFSSKNQIALWCAIGTSFTAVGDYVNSAISPVTPVSKKLTCALFLFGVGYSLYTLALWRYTNTKSRPGWLYFVALAFLVGNNLAWLDYLEPNIRHAPLLYYGSFIFNSTIYVALPTFAVAYWHFSGWSEGGMLVFVGTILIGYSDLVLFASWMKNGIDPDSPPFDLYALNWILYFSAQVLTSLFPSFILK